MVKVKFIEHQMPEILVPNLSGSKQFDLLRLDRAPLSYGTVKVPGSENFFFK